MNIIRTEVPCPTCGSNLCNICGLNGRCQDCMTKIPRATDRELVNAINEYHNKDRRGQE